MQDEKVPEEIKRMLIDLEAAMVGDKVEEYRKLVYQILEKVNKSLAFGMYGSDEVFEKINNFVKSEKSKIVVEKDGEKFEYYPIRWAGYVYLGDDTGVGRYVLVIPKDAKESKEGE